MNQWQLMTRVKRLSWKDRGGMHLYVHWWLNEKGDEIEVHTRPEVGCGREMGNVGVNK